MKFILCIIITVLFSVCLQAQTKSDSIFVGNSFWGNDYYIAGHEFSRSDICNMLETNEFSKDLVNSSYYQKYWGYGTLTTGLYILALSWAEAYTYYDSYGKIPSNAIFFIKTAAGLGLNIAAIILFSKSKKSFRNAIKAYNANLNSKDGANEFNLKLNPNGITLSYSF